MVVAPAVLQRRPPFDPRFNRSRTERSAQFLQSAQSSRPRRFTPDVSLATASSAPGLLLSLLCAACPVRSWKGADIYFVPKPESIVRQGNKDRREDGPERSLPLPVPSAAAPGLRFHSCVCTVVVDSATRATNSCSGRRLLVTRGALDPQFLPAPPRLRCDSFPSLT